MNIAYNMDCMEAMREMPDNAFDLAVVDPPYGDGTEGSGQKVYAEVLDRRDFYQSEPVRQMQLLGAGT